LLFAWYNNSNQAKTQLNTIIQLFCNWFANRTQFNFNFLVTSILFLSLYRNSQSFPKTGVR